MTAVEPRCARESHSDSRSLRRLIAGRGAGVCDRGDRRDRERRNRFLSGEFTGGSTGGGGRFGGATAAASRRGLAFFLRHARSGLLADGPPPDSSAASRSTSVPSVGQIFQPRDRGPAPSRPATARASCRASGPGTPTRICKRGQDRVDRPPFDDVARAEAAAAG